MKHIVFFFILTMIGFGLITLLNSQDQINVEADGQKIIQGPACYCNYDTGFCEGAKVANNKLTC